jgi:hypothetical protein
MQRLSTTGLVDAAYIHERRPICELNITFTYRSGFKTLCDSPLSSAEPPALTLPNLVPKEQSLQRFL